MEKMDFKIKKDCELSIDDIINDYGICGSPDCVSQWEDWIVRKFGQFGLHNPIPHNAIKNALTKLPNAQANAAIQWMKDCDLLEKKRQLKGIYTQLKNELEETEIMAVFEDEDGELEKEDLGTINKRTGEITLFNLSEREGVKETEIALEYPDMGNAFLSTKYV